MATIWVDNHHINKENSGQYTTIKTKQLLSVKNPSVKKQAFGELHSNVRINQHITPFKGITTCTGKVGNWAGSNVVCKPPIKQNSNLNQNDEKESNSVSPGKEIWADFEPEDDLIDCWDFPKSCNTGECHKALGEIWSEMNIFNAFNIGLNVNTKDEEESEAREPNFAAKPDLSPMLPTQPMYDSQLKFDLDREDLAIPLDMPIARFADINLPNI